MTGKEILEKILGAGFTKKDVKRASATLSVMERWEKTSDEDRANQMAKVRAGRLSTKKY